MPFWKIPKMYSDSDNEGIEYEGIEWYLWKQEVLSVLLMTVTSCFLLRQNGNRAGKIIVAVAWVLFTGNVISAGFLGGIGDSAELQQRINNILAATLLIIAIVFQLVPNQQSRKP